MYDHPSPAGAVAAALAVRAEEVCQRYLPHGRRQGRYWVAGDIDGARGRSFFVRLHGPGTPGKWTDAAVGTHGDLLDIIRHRTGAPTLRAALDRSPRLPRPAGFAGSRAIQATTTPPKRPGGFGGDAAPLTARMRRSLSAQARGLARCRFPALRFHPELRYREGSAVRRLPALVAAVTGDDGAVLWGAPHMARSAPSGQG